MNAHKANLFNALTLMVLSIMEFLSKSNPSIQTMIPLVFGVILLALSNGIYYGVRSQLKTSLPVTMTILLILMWELMSQGVTIKMWKSLFMAFTCLVSVIFIGLELNKK